MMKTDLKICSNRRFFGFYRRKEKTTNRIYKPEKYRCYRIKLNQGKVKDNIANLNEDNIANLNEQVLKEQIKKKIEK